MPQSPNIQHVQRFIELLEKLQKRDNFLLNLNKLFEYWGISSEEVEPFIQILMHLQFLFIKESDAVRLYSIWRNGQIYLKVKSPSKHISNNSPIYREVELTREDCNLLNDVVHYFEHIKIGKGFNSKAINSEFAKKIKILNKSYPFLFENRGNGALYPTKLASQLGKTISLYKKSNRKIQDLEMDGYYIKVK